MHHFKHGKNNNLKKKKDSEEKNNILFGKNGFVAYLQQLAK